MEFVHFLSSHMLDPAMGGKRLYRNVVAQAVHAEAVGYRGVAIPEHHLLNILLIPSPLQMAVKIAAHTQHIRLVTSVCQLPIRDMRIFAGEVVQAQALCDGRLMLGVGKGAFGFETARFEEFCHKHLGHLDDVANDFFGTPEARQAVREKTAALFPAHEVEQFTELFWQRIQAWRNAGCP